MSEMTEEEWDEQKKQARERYIKQMNVRLVDDENPDDN